MSALICSSLSSVGNFALPLMAAAAGLTAIMIAIGYMLGQILQNPKVSLWAKTEIFQLVISAIVVVILWMALQGFCDFNFGSVAELFGLNPGNEQLSMYGAAQGYFQTSSVYIRDIIQVARYHLSAYNILQLRSLWQCDESPAVSIIVCMFGSALGMGGGSGVSVAPESGYSFAASMVGVAFNTLLFSYLSILNYFFVLNYVYSGLIFFFLPLGIFFRAMPYLRTLGSLFMAVALAYLFVYPMVLAIFYIDLQTNRVLNPDFSADFKMYIDREKELDSEAGDIALIVLTAGLSDAFNPGIHDDLFPNGDSVEFEIMKLTGHAFLLGVFIPTLAMLSAAGSVMYMNRFLGQEIDLSRIVQMV